MVDKLVKVSNLSLATRGIAEAHLLRCKQETGIPHV